MATIRVFHGIDDLANDLKRIPAKARKEGSKIVRTNVREGREQARMYARASSGPHGKSYYKRITSEMLGPLEGEYGPTGQVAGNAVGGGWRNGPPNMDLPKSADVIGPQFADDIGDMVDGLFW
jgi:hypothetical protein